MTKSQSAWEINHQNNLMFLKYEDDGETYDILNPEFYSENEWNNNETTLLNQKPTSTSTTKYEQHLQTIEKNNPSIIKKTISIQINVLIDPNFEYQSQYQHHLSNLHTTVAEHDAKLISLIFSYIRTCYGSNYQIRLENLRDAIHYQPWPLKLSLTIEDSLTKNQSQFLINLILLKIKNNNNLWLNNVPVEIIKHIDKYIDNQYQKQNIDENKLSIQLNELLQKLYQLCLNKQITIESELEDRINNVLFTNSEMNESITHIIDYKHEQSKLFDIFEQLLVYDGNEDQIYVFPGWIQYESTDNNNNNNTNFNTWCEDDWKNQLDHVKNHIKSNINNPNCPMCLYPNHLHVNYRGCEIARTKKFYESDYDFGSKKQSPILNDTGCKVPPISSQSIFKSKINLFNQIHFINDTLINALDKTNNYGNSINQIQLSNYINFGIVKHLDPKFARNVIVNKTKGESIHTAGGKDGWQAHDALTQTTLPEQSITVIGTNTPMYNTIHHSVKKHHNIEHTRSLMARSYYFDQHLLIEWLRKVFEYCNYNSDNNFNLLQSLLVQNDRELENCLKLMNNNKFDYHEINNNILLNSLQYCVELREQQQLLFENVLNQQYPYKIIEIHNLNNINWTHECHISNQNTIEWKKSKYNIKKYQYSHQQQQFLNNKYKYHTLKHSVKCSGHCGQNPIINYNLQVLETKYNNLIQIIENQCPKNIYILPKNSITKINIDLFSKNDTILIPIQINYDFGLVLIRQNEIIVFSLEMDDEIQCTQICKSIRQQLNTYSSNNCIYDTYTLPGKHVTLTVYEPNLDGVEWLEKIITMVFKNDNQFEWNGVQIVIQEEKLSSKINIDNHINKHFQIISEINKFCKKWNIELQNEYEKYSTDKIHSLVGFFNGELTQLIKQIKIQSINDATSNNILTDIIPCNDEITGKFNKIIEWNINLIHESEPMFELNQWMNEILSDNNVFQIFYFKIMHFIKCTLSSTISPTTIKFISIALCNFKTSIGSHMLNNAHFTNIYQYLIQYLRDLQKIQINCTNMEVIIEEININIYFNNKLIHSEPQSNVISVVNILQKNQLHCPCMTTNINKILQKPTKKIINSFIQQIPWWYPQFPNYQTIISKFNKFFNSTITHPFTNKIASYATGSKINIPFGKEKCVSINNPTINELVQHIQLENDTIYIITATYNNNENNYLYKYENGDLIIINNSKLLNYVSKRYSLNIPDIILIWHPRLLYPSKFIVKNQILEIIINHHHPLSINLSTNYDSISELFNNNVELLFLWCYFIKQEHSTDYTTILSPFAKKIKNTIILVPSKDEYRFFKEPVNIQSKLIKYYPDLINESTNLQKYSKYKLELNLTSNNYIISRKLKPINEPNIDNTTIDIVFGQMINCLMLKNGDNGDYKYDRYLGFSNQNQYCICQLLNTDCDLSLHQGFEHWNLLISNKQTTTENIINLAFLKQITANPPRMHIQDTIDLTNYYCFEITNVQDYKIELKRNRYVLCWILKKKMYLVYQNTRPITKPTNKFYLRGLEIIKQIDSDNNHAEYIVQSFIPIAQSEISVNFQYIFESITIKITKNECISLIQYNKEISPSIIDLLVINQLKQYPNNNQIIYIPFLWRSEDNNVLDKCKLKYFIQQQQPILAIPFKNRNKFQIVIINIKKQKIILFSALINNTKPTIPGNIKNLIKKITNIRVNDLPLQTYCVNNSTDDSLFIVYIMNYMIKYKKIDKQINNFTIFHTRWTLRIVSWELIIYCIRKYGNNFQNSKPIIINRRLIKNIKTTNDNINTTNNIIKYWQKMESNENLWHFIFEIFIRKNADLMQFRIFENIIDDNVKTVDIIEKKIINRKVIRQILSMTNIGQLYDCYQQLVSNPKPHTIVLKQIKQCFHFFDDLEMKYDAEKNEMNYYYNNNTISIPITNNNHLIQISNFYHLNYLLPETLTIESLNNILPINDGLFQIMTLKQFENLTTDNTQFLTIVLFQVSPNEFAFAIYNKYKKISYHSQIINTPLQLLMNVITMCKYPTCNMYFYSNWIDKLFKNQILKHVIKDLAFDYLWNMHCNIICWNLDGISVEINDETKTIIINNNEYSWDYVAPMIVFNDLTVQLSNTPFILTFNWFQLILVAIRIGWICWPFTMTEIESLSPVITNNCTLKNELTIPNTDELKTNEDVEIIHVPQCIFLSTIETKYQLILLKYLINNINNKQIDAIFKLKEKDENILMIKHILIFVSNTMSKKYTSKLFILDCLNKLLVINNTNKLCNMFCNML